ncbi:nucleoside-diphosphate kinase [candidate division WWE3 bacterium CG08_land_8_20_14_0_20_43_13]|uniref:nucleoside-diphosphate kinase n=1 Tax=candidate division WWE3 bacterium CG08_land_8_20_14_0_20_43_13 TaxID=1975087 RepID=A0A2H0XA11_UNCKA|nr:MAG: nucleoside-diphosphate kinase [candidate division WWE3 bacterium CG08_land_8_20_14_0_20_43_13]
MVFDEETKAALPIERTFIAVKPDGIQRQLIGEIIGRFERRGLKMIGCKLLVRTEEQLARQYPNKESWLVPLGTRTLAGYADKGIKVDKTPIEIGQDIRQKLINGLAGKPFLAMVWEGAHAVELGRKTVGATNPLAAVPGTIRGDFSVESYFLSDQLGHPARNLVHASGDLEEAKSDISIYFKESELIDYPFVLDEVLYGNEGGRVA